MQLRLAGGREPARGRPPASTVGAGDFDGDGFEDIVWYEDGVLPAVGVFFSDGTRFQNAGDWGLFAVERLSPPDWSGTGDFNGDGKADVMWYRHAQGIQVFISDGQRFWDTGDWIMKLNWQWNPAWAVVGDVTADGKDDVVWQDGSGEVMVLKSTGTGFLTTRPWYPTPLMSPTRVLVGNYNAN